MIKLLIFDTIYILKGIFKVAFDKNNRYHRTIKTTPYECLNEQKPRVEMRDLPIDFVILRSLKTELELVQILGFKDHIELSQTDAIDEMD